MRKIVFLVSVALISVFSGVIYSRHQSSGPKDSRSTITLGAALALTGDAAAWGEAEKNGITLALEELNDESNQPKVEVVFEDTHSLPPQTVLATSKLIEVDHVQAIIGPTWMDSYAGAAPLSDAHKIVMLTPSGAVSAIKAEKSYPYVFSTWYDADTNARALTRIVAQSGHKRIALVYEQDAYWQDIAMRVKANAHSEGLTIIVTEETKRGESDFRTTLAKLKTQPLDAIVFGFLSEGEVLAFLKQRTEFGLTIPMYSNESVVDVLPKESFHGLTDGIGSVVPVTKNGGFATRYREHFGKDPVFSASNAYDATMMLAESLRRATSSEALVTALRNESFHTATFGKVNFEANGAIKDGAFVLKTVQAGKLIEQK